MGCPLWSLSYQFLCLQKQEQQVLFFSVPPLLSALLLLYLLFIFPRQKPENPIKSSDTHTKYFFFPMLLTWRSVLELPSEQRKVGSCTRESPAINALGHLFWTRLQTEIKPQATVHKKTKCHYPRWELLPFYWKPQSSLFHVVFPFCLALPLLMQLKTAKHHPGALQPVFKKHYFLLHEILND